MSTIKQRLKDMGIDLPQPASPVANYVPFSRSGNLVHVSGQLSIDEEGGVRGVVGVTGDAEMARQGARLCGMDLLAQFKAACRATGIGWSR